MKKISKIFPDDFEGNINLVFIAFLRRHQDVIDEWVPFVDKIAQENEQLHYYEFPTLSRGGPLYRVFLNEGMRAGIPDKATRARTITLYLDKAAFRAALDIDSEQHIWIYLFDRDGLVLGRIKGHYTEEKGAELMRLIAEE